MISLRVLAISGLLLVTPVAIVLFANAETIGDSFYIEGSEAQGKVLFFTAPSR